MVVDLETYDPPIQQYSETFVFLENFRFNLFYTQEIFPAEFSPVPTLNSGSRYYTLAKKV